MDQADIIFYLGELCGAYVLGWCTGAFFLYIKKFGEQV